MKYCIHCGEPNSNESKYCSKCLKLFPIVGTPEQSLPKQNFDNTASAQSVQNTAAVKYCQNCGTQCVSQAVVCPNCGVPFQKENNAVQRDEPTTPLKVICFLFPIVGLILYILYQDKKPKSAKEYGKMALIGVVVGVISAFVLPPLWSYIIYML